MGRAKRAMGALAVVAMLAVTLIQLPSQVDAQQDPVTVIARGLTTPGGFTWNANDVLFVALAGSGGETGAAAIIDDGCPTALATGIASVRTAQGRIYGAEAIAELDGQLYLLFSDAGAPSEELDLTNGVYRIGGDGSLQLIADHAAFVAETLPGVTASNPVALSAGDGALWIADEGTGLISRVTPGGDETLVANLSSQGFAPTDLALGADGSVYASGLGDPAQPGSGSVVNISANGDIQTVWSGLTLASGIAIGNDGLLYATELASGVSDSAPNGLPGSGRLLRQTGADTAEVVADGLMYPAALGTGPDGAVYFISGAVGSTTGSGWIGRYAPDGSRADAAPLDCEPIAETLSDDAPSAEASPSADEPAIAPDTPTPAPSPTPRTDETWTPDGAAPTGEIIEVGLTEYAIDMPTQLSAGPVTFLVTNYGTLEHSFQIEGPGIDVALTHTLAPGQQGAFSVDLVPGSYSIFCPIAGHRESGMSFILTVS